MNSNKSKISNIEWGLVIGVLFLCDGFQILIEWLLGWLVIGEIINFFLDVFIGMSFALYLQLRGQTLANPKRLAGLVGTFILEMIPVVEELPLWGLDGILNMVMSKSETILSKIPGGSVIEQGLEMASGKGTGRPVEDIQRSTSQIRELNTQIKNRSDSNQEVA